MDASHGPLLRLMCFFFTYIFELNSNASDTLDAD